MVVVMARLGKAGNETAISLRDETAVSRFSSATRAKSGYVEDGPLGLQRSHWNRLRSRFQPFRGA